MKSNILKRFLVICLSLMIASSFLIGCKKKDDGTGPGDTAPPDEIDDSWKDFDGNHDINVSEREGEYIVKDGKTDFVIVYPAAATSREMTAVSELITMFEMATDISLNYVSDESVSYTDTAKYLSVGPTKLVTEAGIAGEFTHAVLLRTGVRVLTKGNTIFLSGADDYGTLYSVYEFLAHAFNYEAFSDNIIRINKGVDESPMLDFDITSVPDFQFNVASHYGLRLNAEWRNRFRMIELQEQTVSQMTNGNIYHNSLDWLPFDVHGAGHPNWYSTITSPYRNLCYNARGDSEELASLKAAATALIIERVKAEPTKEYIAFNHMDTQTLCNCTTCVAERAKYNNGDANNTAGDAAGVIKFLNDVRAQLQTWFDTEEGKPYDHGQKILFFAYHATNYPPVKTVDGKIVPYDESLVLRGIVPWFAETNGDYTVALTDSSVSTYQYNKIIAKNLADWHVLTDEILFWTYGTNFSHYLTPYPSFNAFQETYKFAAAQGVKALYAQHQTDNDMSTAFERLKAYLNYKVGWNVNEDVNKLTQEFMDAYFGPAAGTFKEIFEELLILGEEQKLNGYVTYRSEFHNANQAKYWPRNLLVKWNTAMTNALALIEPLKTTDPELYNAYYFNIALERIWPAYLTVQVYSGTLSAAETTSLKLQVKADAVLTGVNRWYERNYITVLWSNWGV